MKKLTIEELASNASILSLRTQILTHLIDTAIKLDINDPSKLVEKADKFWEWVTKPLTDEKK